MNEPVVSMSSQQFDVMVATACNARCPFCVQEATFKSGQTSDHRFLAAFKAHFADFHSAGGRRVVITGGEPLLVPERVLGVLNLLLPYDDLEVKALYTNGHRLLRPSSCRSSTTIATALHEGGLGCVNLSVHHDDPGVNNRIMGVRSEPEAVAITEHLKTVGLRFRMNLTLQRGGIEDTDGLVRYARWACGLGAVDIYVRELFHLQFDSPRTDTDRRPVDYTRTNRVPVLPLINALARRSDFRLIGKHSESLRDKTEWTFLDLVTERRVNLARLTVGTESAAGTPYLVLMPDGCLYRGWLGTEERIARIGVAEKYVGL